MEKENLPSVKEQLELAVGSETAQKVEAYYGGLDKNNANQSTEEFVKRAQENLNNTLGDKSYSEYVKDVQSNIGNIRQNATQNDEVTNTPKNK